MIALRAIRVRKIVLLLMGLELNPEHAPQPDNGELLGVARFKVAMQVSTVAVELVGKIARPAHRALNLAPFLTVLEHNPELAQLTVSGELLEVALWPPVDPDITQVAEFVSEIV